MSSPSPCPCPCPCPCPSPSPSPSSETEARLAALERENAKLRKINSVLMERVERSMDFQGNAFSLFQTAIVLESKVRERTMALESALHELERSNAALTAAMGREEMAKARLSEAIEAISEGFMLTDSADQLVLFNSKYRELWPSGRETLQPGLSFGQMIHNAIYNGQVIDPDGNPAAWLERRMASHLNPGEPFVLQFAGGIWVQVSERRTADGGVVGIYTDITEVKASERRLRERELAQKSQLLQATLDSLSQGVSVFDASMRLVAWNARFAQLLGLPPDLPRPGAPLADFLVSDAVRTQFPKDASQDFADSAGSAHLTFEYGRLAEDSATGPQVLEVRRHGMPDGGFVTTYSDITERKRSEQALRDSEFRYRLITDAMPALIAYVDKEERYRFVNKAFENWFGRPRGSFQGLDLPAVLGQELYEKRRHFVALALSGRECSFEMAMTTGADQSRHTMATYVPHFSAEGEVQGFFALIQDITERKLAADALRDAMEGLERRVEERTRELRGANDALNQAKGEAEQANLSKTKFLAAASHDLLQPLNAARVFASALGERRLAPRNRSLAENTLAALDSVDEILNALLDISKLDAGVFHAEVVDFSIAALMGAMKSEHEIQARNAGLTFRVHPCDIVVRSDHRLLGRILRNFIANAIRYTDKGGILVGCRRQGEHLLLGVWDSGIGIPADKQTEIFEEFRRLDHGGREKGVGLGLAIVQRIARKLDLEVVLTSRPGRGSLFGVKVPLGDPAAAAERQSLPSRQPANSLVGTLVLTIDNDRSILAGMTALLEGWSCRTLPAASEEDAVLLLTQQNLRPDMIIADYHLDRGKTGLAAIAHVQSLWAEAGTPPIPALVVTADHTPEVLGDVKAAGYHLLNKPIKPARLRSLMAHLLGQLRKEAEAEKGE